MVATDVSRKFYTIEEYLKMENAAFEKHEFDNGTLTDMSGGTAPHNAVKFRIASLLDRFFEETGKPLFVFDSDMKIRIERTNRFYYPDAAVVFEGPDYYISPNGIVRRTTMTNPILVVEVLSNSTRDKGEKFENYRSLPSFREYLLVEPEKNWVETRFKPDPTKDLWEIKNYDQPEAIFSLQSIGCDLKVADLYARLLRMKL